MIEAILVAPQVLGSTPRGVNLNRPELKKHPSPAVFLSYTYNHLSRFQRDARGRRHVSWVLGGMSRPASLRGVAWPCVGEASS